jgi:probable HAF family extracellular repeat protein
MRPLVLSSIMLSAAFVVGCGVDNIQAPSPSARSPILARGESRAERAFDFTTIDVPGAVFTSASGINARGDIVGSYTDGTGRAHGFLLRDGEFTTIDFPESVASDARGIGPDGDIVGTYRLAGQTGQSHGYVRTKDGAFVAVNSTGHINTIAQRILADGTILGCRHDNDIMESMKGIMVSREGYSETEVFASMHNGATPDRRHIVGLYTNMEAGNRGEGYRIDDGVFTALLVPNSTSTAAWDINPAGQIVGVYRSTDAKVHGFVLRDEGYVTIDFPGATVTRAFGINARGDVVGNYIAAGTTHGYLASR